jgi:hypothetical protein
MNDAWLHICYILLERELFRAKGQIKLIARFYIILYDMTLA